MTATDTAADQISVEDFEAEVAAWLKENAKPKIAEDGPAPEWGEGEFSVSIFHNLEHDNEQNLLDEIASWIQTKSERGYNAITWPVEYGGLGLSQQHARAYSRLERAYDVPGRHEAISVTMGLMAPTINLFGSDDQKAQHIETFLRAQELCIQLFSGQKVWTSGAQFAQWGQLIARSDVDAPKHKGQTAFILPLDLPGVEVRPIKQMSGGTSFNEVFFNDVRVPDSMRLGDEGEGWKVALTTLGFERDHSQDAGGGGSTTGGSWIQVLDTARALGLADDPVIRQKLADLYIHLQVESHTLRRGADLAKGGTPGPEGSLGKLLWTEGMTRMSDVISDILGCRLIADTGEWGTYGWGEHVLGAPGYRIAGGSDEIQRNIIGERVLGLPGEPRTDKGMAWKDVPR
jgi:alkylation response protein AidB-like acyl-CoA dehydrogenase